jgi:hypothetical protein
MTDDERRRLERLLASARRRLGDATPHSPDWDAAADAVDELERQAREAGLLLEEIPAAEAAIVSGS